MYKKQVVWGYVNPPYKTMKNENKQETRLKSEKPIMETKAVFGRRKFIFDMQYASECDSATGKKGMIVSINSSNKFIPCGEPTDLTYSEWALLKNIGRIPRIVSVPIEETPDETTAE